MRPNTRDRSHKSKDKVYANGQFMGETFERKS
ncbi:MAG: Uncharacterised protein [Porticoccaceae bacterium UBA1117]|nr:MAG: Uncharacterised protein [Porticoccaceae bacterium UBA1117]